MGWYNSDGLYVKFGTEEGASATIGENRTLGAQREVEIILDLTTLTTSDVILDYTQFIPSNAFIEAVEVETLVSSTGNLSTLSVGLYKSDTTTAISSTGLVNALALATIGNAGARTTLVLGSTGAGATIGSTPGFPALISAKYAGTGAFTAGRVAIRVRYNQKYNTI